MIVNDDVITMMMMMTDDEYRYLEHEHEDKSDLANDLLLDVCFNPIIFILYYTAIKTD